MVKKILLGVGVLILILGVVGFFHFRQIMQGVEDEGRVTEAVPQAAPVQLPPLTVSEKDWPCWRNADGTASAQVDNLRLDWAGGLSQGG
ncbi:MAG: hypothetical protein ACYTGH_05000, partial [Planctomycetota bacterium]